MSELSDKLAELENRVANLKDWKKKYEEDKGKWDKERGELQKGNGSVKKLRDVLREFLDVDSAAGASSPDSAGVEKETLNLTYKELIVNLAHEEREIVVSTATVMGKILWAALTELNPGGFSEAELTDALKEHGWNISHNTLAPTIGGLVKDGHLIRVVGAKPARYRLPKKAKVEVNSPATSSEKGRDGEKP